MTPKWLWIGIICLILSPASVHSQDRDTVSAPEKRYPGLIQLIPTDSGNAQPSKLYIDTVRIVPQKNRKALLIQGTLPDGCTHIGSAEHTLAGHRLSLVISAWRDPELFCTQALVPFSFIYRDFPDSALNMVDNVVINGKTYSLKDNRN